jgi:hypothetical protein
MSFPIDRSFGITPPCPILTPVSFPRRNLDGSSENLIDAAESGRLDWSQSNATTVESLDASLPVYQRKPPCCDVRSRLRVWVLLLVSRRGFRGRVTETQQTPTTRKDKSPEPSPTEDSGLSTFQGLSVVGYRYEEVGSRRSEIGIRQLTNDAFVKFSAVRPAP